MTLLAAPESTNLFFWRKGGARSYASLGQLVHGFAPVHYSLPLVTQSVTSVELRVRSARTHNIRGLDSTSVQALEHLAQRFDLGNLEVVAKVRTMIERQRDLGERQAENAAALYALALALEIELSPEVVSDIITALDSPAGLTGVAYHQSNLLSSDGHVLADASGLPRLNTASFIPRRNFSRDCAPHAGDADLYADTLELLKNPTARGIGELASRSSAHNAETAAHPFYVNMLETLDRTGVSAGESYLGLATSASSARVTLLFDSGVPGHRAASGAVHHLSPMFEDVWSSVSTTYKPNE